MSRPRRATVEYFPHYCNPGRTLYILQEKFGNDGYAFYYKLRELLGETEGHYYALVAEADWQYLAARTGVDQCQAKEILDTMANLAAIDPDLYRSGTIWSDGFIEIVEPVYSRRKTDPPDKPEINTSQLSITPTDTPLTEPKSNNNRQSKVKRVKKVKDTKSRVSLGAPEFLNTLYSKYPGVSITTELDRFNDYLDAKGKVYKDYRAAFRNWLSSPYQGDNNKPSQGGTDKVYYFAECPECNWKKIVDHTHGFHGYCKNPECKNKPEMLGYKMTQAEAKLYEKTKKSVEAHA